MMTKSKYPRFPFETLDAYLTYNFDHDYEDFTEVDGVRRLSNGRVADLCGLVRSTVITYRASGIPWDAADEIAVHLGLVPVLLWPEHEHEEIHELDTVPRRLQGKARYAVSRGRSIEHLCDDHQQAM